MFNPARSHAGDLAGKYWVQASPKDFEATLLGPNPPPGDSDRVMLSRDRSPRSESKHPVEIPSSCDTGHNARLAMKGRFSSHRSKCTSHTLTGFRLNDRYPVPGARFHRSSRVNRVLRPHRVHRSHRVIRSHRVTRSYQFTLVRKLKRKRPTSVWISLSFLFLIHRTDRCN